MLRNFFICCILCLLVSPGAFAEYPLDVSILDKPAITRLTDEQLIDTYENTIVEIEANRSFHSTSGFSPKEYKDYKALLKFRLLLLVEIHSRNLELPQF
ncbi:MAG: hypothetical protein HQL13_05740 [Candidatus Omnitrophica bacterium]|nr:hypothetical protein [Candidatus Omnitrophota bacterium]